MPKIFGMNIFGIIAAAIALYSVGFIWYGMLFSQQWQTLTGMTEAGNMDAQMIIGGFLICLLPAFGLAAILNWAGASRLITCVKIALTVSVLLIVPALAAGNVYQSHPLSLLAIDGSHSVIGFSLMGAVLSFFRGDSARNAG